MKHRDDKYDLYVDRLVLEADKVLGLNPNNYFAQNNTLVFDRDYMRCLFRAAIAIGYDLGSMEREKQKS